MRNAAKCLAIVVLLLLPATARAQVITGTVRDGSGGVLPGVTVEASSPVLIEKTRTVVVLHEIDGMTHAEIARTLGEAALSRF